MNTKKLGEIAAANRRAGHQQRPARHGGDTMTRDRMTRQLRAVLDICERAEMDEASLRAAVCVRVGEVLAALSTPAPVAAPPADLVAKKIADCNRVRAFLEQRARANGRLRDALSYAEAAAMIGAYADALLAFPLPEVPDGK